MAVERRRLITKELTGDQVDKIAQAFTRARKLSAPLNAHFTVHWAFAPSEAHPLDRLQRLFDSMRRWFSYRGITMTFVYVWERGANDLQHVHIALYVPVSEREAFEAKAHDWVRQSMDKGEFYDEAAVKVVFQWSPTMAKLRDYLIKGTDAATAKRYSAKRQYGGKVEGKRCEISINLRDRSWPDHGDGRAPLPELVQAAA